MIEKYMLNHCFCYEYLISITWSWARRFLLWMQKHLEKSLKRVFICQISKLFFNSIFPWFKLLLIFQAYLVIKKVKCQSRFHVHQSEAWKMLTTFHNTKKICFRFRSRLIFNHNVFSCSTHSFPMVSLTITGRDVISICSKNVWFLCGWIISHYDSLIRCQRSWTYNSIIYE